jgi:hypothetical protein
MTAIDIDGPGDLQFAEAAAVARAAAVRRFDPCKALDQ